MPWETFTWSYNATAAEGLPAIVLNDALLSSAAAATSERGAQRIEESYRFATLDGAGTQVFGLASEQIAVLIQFTTASAANRIAWLDKLRQHLGSGKRLELKSEFGDTWSYCELAAMTPARPVERSGEQWLWEITLTFQNNQPRSGA